MNSMLKVMISFILFLLIMTIVGQEDYTSIGSKTQYTSCSSYRQTQNPCKKTMDFILTNRFADMPQAALTLDNPDVSSKSKCILRLLAAFCENRKQELQTIHIDYHLQSSFYSHAVDYYIYALRRIII